MGSAIWTLRTFIVRSREDMALLGPSGVAIVKAIQLIYALYRGFVLDDRQISWCRAATF